MKITPSKQRASALFAMPIEQWPPLLALFVQAYNRRYGLCGDGMFDAMCQYAEYAEGCVPDKEYFLTDWARQWFQEQK